MVNDRAGKPNYRAVIIVAACFLMVFSCLGFCSSAKGLYLAAITEALSLKRSLFSINDSCRFIATAIINLFFGALVSRFGERKLIAAGFASLILSMLLYSVAESIYVFYIGGVLLGIGLAWTTTTMVAYVVDRWCRERKGSIMGAVLAANGLGGAVAAQIVTPIIYSEGSSFGYRTAYRFSAALLAVVGVIVVLAIRDKPRISDAPQEKKMVRGTSWEGVSFEEAIKMPRFYIAALCVFLTGVSLQSVSGVSSAHLRDIGFNEVFIAAIVSMHSFALAAFKFLSGICYDKIGLRKTMLICNAAAITAPLLLAVMQAGTVGSALAIAYGLISSLALPLETIMLPLIAADLFGKKAYPKLLGIYVSVNTAGYAIGVPLANFCYDTYQTYTPIFFTLSGIMLAVMIVFQRVLRRSELERGQCGNS